MDEKRINGVMHVLLKCDNCGKGTWKKKSNIKTNPGTFCCRGCENEWKRTGQDFDCANPSCTERVWRTASEQRRSKSGEYFCSRSCATIVNNSRHKSGKNHGNWMGGDATYRDRAIRYYGAKCSNSSCEIGIAGVDVPVEMLDVHHIKGRKNHLLENLEVLCVWCHAKLTRNI